MTKVMINKAIKHTGLEIQHKRGDSYSYFTDLKTNYQIGYSVYVCYLNQMTLEEWVKEAEYALEIEQKRKI